MPPALRVLTRAMSFTNASALLRPGLLAGASIVVAGAPAVGPAGAALGAAVAAACAGLGARVFELELGGAATSAQQGSAVDGAVERVLGESGGAVQMLVVDAASVFAAAGVTATAGQQADVERSALRACLQDSWNTTRALAARAFLTGGRGGRVVYLAPATDAGGHADAARAGLENLARTLSIEWARHAVTAVTISPGAAPATSSAASPSAAAGEVAVLTAYLASPAGAYFSGCLLDLRGPFAGAPSMGLAGHPSEDAARHV